MCRNARQCTCWLALLVSLLLLTGCGLTQGVRHGTASVTHAIFYPRVDTLQLQLAARSALNTNEAEMASPVEVRIWPLRNTAAFSQASYSALLKQSSQVLANDFSGNPVTLRVMPGHTVAVDVPLADDVQAVAIAAFFLYPDMRRDTWRRVIARSDMHTDNPTIIELNNRELRMRGKE